MPYPPVQLRFSFYSVMFFLLGWSLTFVLQTWNWSSLVFQRGLLPGSAGSPFSFTLMWGSPLLSPMSQVLSSLSLLGDVCAERGQQRTSFCCDTSLQLNSVFPQAALFSHLSGNLSAYLQTCSDFNFFNFFFSDAVWSQANIDDKNLNFNLALWSAWRLRGICVITTAGNWQEASCVFFVPNPKFFVSFSRGSKRTIIFPLWAGTDEAGEISL